MCYGGGQRVMMMMYVCVCVSVCECVCVHSVIHNTEAPEQAPAGNVRGAL